MNWISVKCANNSPFVSKGEEEPPYGERVLVNIKAIIRDEPLELINYIRTATYCCCNGWKFDDPRVMPKGTFFKESVTHWAKVEMPT